MQNASYVELEQEFAEVIDLFFETARIHDFEGAENVTHLPLPVSKRSLFGAHRSVRGEGLVNSLAYKLEEATFDEEGTFLAVEGTFIMFDADTLEWPYAIQRPSASQELINQIRLATERIAS